MISINIFRRNKLTDLCSNSFIDVLQNIVHINPLLKVVSFFQPVSTFKLPFLFKHIKFNLQKVHRKNALYI